MHSVPAARVERVEPTVMARNIVAADAAVQVAEIPMHVAMASSSPLAAVAQRDSASQVAHKVESVAQVA